MTLIIPVTLISAQLLAGVWTLKSPQATRNKRGFLKLLRWLEGEFTKAFLKRNKLGAGLGQSVGTVW